MIPGEGLFRYGWRFTGKRAGDARGPFEGERCTVHPMTRADFLKALARWNANPHGWTYWELPQDGKAPAPQYADYHGANAPFPHYNPARDGWTVKALADLLAGYARNNPDAIVRFTSCGPGGQWPQGREPLGVFTDHAAAVVDASRCGGGITFGIALMPFKEPETKPAPARWAGQPGTL